MTIFGNKSLRKKRRGRKVDKNTAVKTILSFFTTWKNLHHNEARSRRLTLQSVALHLENYFFHKTFGRKNVEKSQKGQPKLNAGAFSVAQAAFGRHRRHNMPGRWYEIPNASWKNLGFQFFSPKPRCRVFFGCLKFRPWSVKTLSLQLSNKQRDPTIAFIEKGRHS